MINDPQNVNVARAWDGKRMMASPRPVANALFVSRLYPASHIAAALPLDGSRPLTDDWDLGDKKLTGVGVLSTDELHFTETVTEGDPCTNTPGYKSLAMGTNHYLQICTDGKWVHANEDVTVVTNTVIHQMPVGGWGSGGSSGGSVGGYLGSDGQLYSTPNAQVGVDSPCAACSRVQGMTDENAGDNNGWSWSGGGSSSSSGGYGSIDTSPSSGFDSGSWGSGGGGYSGDSGE